MSRVPRVSLYKNFYFFVEKMNWKKEVDHFLALGDGVKGPEFQGGKP